LIDLSYSHRKILVVECLCS